MQITVVRARYKHTDNSRLPAEALETMVTGARTRGRPKKDG